MTEETRGSKTSEGPEPAETTEAVDSDAEARPDHPDTPETPETEASGGDEATEGEAETKADDDAADEAGEAEAPDAGDDADADTQAEAKAAKAKAEAAKAEAKAAKAKARADAKAARARARADRPRRDLRHWARTLKPVPVILVLLLVISGGVAVWLYYNEYRPDRQVDPSVAGAAAVKAASEGTVALLSYSPDTLDKDFAAARSHLAGDFLSYYNQFTEQIVAPAAKQKSLKTSAHVMRAGIQEIHPDSAVMLVFVDQSTTSKDNPDPAMAASSVLVTLTPVNGQWLITKFTPI